MRFSPDSIMPRFVESNDLIKAHDQGSRLIELGDHRLKVRSEVGWRSDFICSMHASLTPPRPNRPRRDRSRIAAWTVPVQIVIEDAVSAHSGYVPMDEFPMHVMMYSVSFPFTQMGESGTESLGGSGMRGQALESELHQVSGACRPGWTQKRRRGAGIAVLAERTAVDMPSKGVLGWISGNDLRVTGRIMTSCLMGPGRKRTHA